MTRKNDLLEIVDKKALKDILSAFTLATGLRAFIVDTEGKPILAAGKDFNNFQFCQTIWEYQGNFNRCQAAYERAGKQAAQYGEPYIFRCPSGLIEWAAPILIEDIHYGSIICGQVLMWEPEDFFWIEVGQMTKSIGADLDRLKEAVKECDIVSSAKVHAASDLLFLVSTQIMKTGMESLKQKQKINRQQARINEEIENRKALEEELAKHTHTLDYTLEKERELMSKVKLGDQEAAKKVLDELMADIFLKSAAKMNVLKARILELAVILSRSAVEGGAELETIELSYQQIKEIENMATIEEVQLWITNVVEKFLEEVCKTNNIKNRRLIEQITKYIRNNFKGNLTLEEISKAVFLSPYYLSHIFKEEQGITIMDYVTTVRIEEAKRLLREPQYNILQIAELTGYSDPSYFSKVFRKVIGMSPTQFKNKAL